MKPPFLSIDGLSKRIDGLQIVDAVSTTVAQGETKGVVGPNGAGKTTFLNLLTGGLRADSGHVFLREQEITRMSVMKRCAVGLARSFQINSLFPSLTLRENLAVAGMGRSETVLGLWPRRASLVNAKVESVASTFDLERDLDRRVDEIPYGTQRSAELALALMLDPDMLLLDEPSSGLGLSERNALGELLLAIAGSGVTMMIVEHDLDLVRTVCDSMLVLDRGRVVADGEVASIISSDEVNRIYIRGD